MRIHSGSGVAKRNHDVIARNSINRGAAAYFICGNIGFNDKRTTINIGLSDTQGDTHAEWNANGRAGSFSLDAYPGEFTQYNIPGVMIRSNGVVRMIYQAPLITGGRNDVALTGGVTQI